jgi:hypothetical protein
MMRLTPPDWRRATAAALGLRATLRPHGRPRKLVTKRAASLLTPFFPPTSGGVSEFPTGSPVVVPSRLVGPDTRT